MPHHARRWHNLPARQIVRYVEEAADKGPVAGDTRFHDGRSVACRRTFAEKAALGASGYDDGVLDHLRFHQPQHFGAEVLTPVRPPQAAAGDVAAAQVHAFDLGRVDEYLDLRAR